MLADPARWSNAYSQLSSVAPEASLHLAVLDFYLTQEWYSLAQQTGAENCSAFYLDRSTVHHINSGTLQHTLRKWLLLPQQGVVKQCPILFIQGHDEGTHHKLVLLDYVANRVFLFGASGLHGDDTLYAQWNNNRLWNAICHEFGWVRHDQEPSAFQLDWIQVCESSQLPANI